MHKLIWSVACLLDVKKIYWSMHDTVHSRNYIVLLVRKLVAARCEIIEIQKNYVMAGKNELYFQRMTMYLLFI